MSKKKSSTKAEIMQPHEMYLDHERTALQHVHTHATPAEKRVLLMAEDSFKDNPQYLKTLKECKFVWQRPRTPKFINGRYNADQKRYYRVTLRGITALETLFTHAIPPVAKVAVNVALVGTGGGVMQALPTRKRHTPNAS